MAALTTVVPYNDASSLDAAFQRIPGEIADFILEPVAAHIGVVLPLAGYLEAAALPVLGRRLRRREPERHAGLRTLARD